MGFYLVSVIARTVVIGAVACSAGSVLVDGATAQTLTTTGIAVSAPTPTPAPLSLSEKKTLWSQFQKALDNEEKASEHREKAEMKQLSAAQNAKRKSWRDQEKKNRAQFFDQHTAGHERRDYLQDYIARKKALDQSLEDALAATKKTWLQRRDELKESRKDREKKFKTALDQNQRPDDLLWPRWN